MKQVLIALLLLVSFGTLQAQKAKTLEGSGNITRKELPVSAFTHIVAEGMYSLTLRSGTTESIVVETDDNLQEYFQVEQDGEKLKITQKSKDGQGLNFRSKTTMNVYVTVRNLQKLELSLMGTTRTDGTLAVNELRVENKSMGAVTLDLRAQHFELLNESMGQVTLRGTAADAGILQKGMGKLEAGSFKVGSLTLANKGMGHATVNAEKELIYKDSFLGKVTNVGAAKAVVKIQ